MWATGRHAPQQLPPQCPHLPSPIPPIPKAPTTTRGTATTTHAAHSETASRGGADGEAEALTPVVEWSRATATGVRGGRGLVTGQPASQETGMGQGKANPPGPRPQKAAVGWRRRRGGGSGGVRWGAYGRSRTENISGDGRGNWEGSPPVARAYSGTGGRSSCLDGSTLVL